MLSSFICSAAAINARGLLLHLLFLVSTAPTAEVIAALIDSSYGRRTPASLLLLTRVALFHLL